MMVRFSILLVPNQINKRESHKIDCAKKLKITKGDYKKKGGVKSQKNIAVYYKKKEATYMRKRWII